MEKEDSSFLKQLKKYGRKLKNTVLVLLSHFISLAILLIVGFFAALFFGVQGLTNEDFLSPILALIAIYFAALTFFMTKRIAFVQQWNELMAEYRTHDFGTAIKRVVDFFINDCNNEIEKVAKMYVLRSKSEKNLPERESLNFQRRLVAQYYWHLYICTDKYFGGDGYLKNYFTKNEMNIIAIVYAMSVAAGNHETYKPLWKDDRGAGNTKYTINNCMKELYYVFGSLFKNDRREPLELIAESEKTDIPQNPDFCEENTTQTTYKEEKTMSDKKLIFTKGGNIVHSAYTVDDSKLKPYVYSNNIQQKASMNDNTVGIVYLKSNVSAISQSAFESCKELQIVEYADDGKLLDSSETGKLDIKSSATESFVHFHAFKDCDKLHTVVFPKNCTVSIEKEAFIGCKNLRTVALPDGDAVISTDAFTGCDKDKLVFITAGDENCAVARFARENGFCCKQVDNF